MMYISNYNHTVQQLTIKNLTDRHHVQPTKKENFRLCHATYIPGEQKPHLHISGSLKSRYFKTLSPHRLFNSRSKFSIQVPEKF